jgi:hypothetical protein
LSGIGVEGGAGTWAKVKQEASRRGKRTARRNLGIGPFVSYSDA